MITRTSYIKGRHTSGKREPFSVKIVLRKVKSLISRIIRALSFDADNIMKSREWPYY